MDTYKRSIRGLQSRSNGEHFEGMIIAASRFYEERGIAAVDKTPEAFKVLKAMDRNRGQFICCFTKQAQPDFKGILMDSTMILFDAKHTDKDKISRDVVTAEQQACFERYMKLGAMRLMSWFMELWWQTMENKTCKTCKYNDNLLCDRKGIWIQDDDTCSKWQQDNMVTWQETMLAKFLRTR